MTDSALPEADRAPGAPHPREALSLFGQEEAEGEFLGALEGRRLHHAWLLTGPRGVGKATLAWRIARAVLAARPGTPIRSLELAAGHPIHRSTLALSEPRLFLLRRGWDKDAKRLKTVITVDDVRRMKSFFNLSATDGDRRIVIVDAVDEMNVNAANALLKLLEEPPAGAVLLLVCHNPSQILPTIRSRCRELRCRPLGPDDMTRAIAAAGSDAGPNAAQLSELAGGSAGEALRLLHDDGCALYKQIVALLTTMPNLDRAAAMGLSDSASGRANESRYDTLLRLIDLALVRLARSGAGRPPEIEAAPGEAALAARLAPTAEAARHWATLHQSFGARARQGRAVNLDPSSLLLDMVLKMNETAADLARRRETA